MSIQSLMEIQPTYILEHCGGHAEISIPRAALAKNRYLLRQLLLFLY